MKTQPLKVNPVKIINAASLLSVLVLLIFPITVIGASFDCKKSCTFVEQAICINKRLSKLDDKLAEEYKKAIEIAFAPDVLKQEQRDWLDNERNVCQDVACLKRVYKERIEYLATYDERQRVSSGIDPCEFSGLKLPEEYSIFAAGGYSGREINFQIDQSGHQATQMDVVVNYSSKPRIKISKIRDTSHIS